MDPGILGRLLNEQAAALVLYARQWCAVPEDVVQEAFIQLVRQSRPPERVVPWLFRVVRNGAISSARKAKRQRRHENLAVRGQSWFEPSFDDRLDGAAATAALEQLPGNLREIITLHLWGGLTFAEIAEVTGTPSSTVHRRYQEGLELLRLTLKAPCPNKN